VAHARNWVEPPATAEAVNVGPPHPLIRVQGELDTERAKKAYVGGPLQSAAAVSETEEVVLPLAVAFRLTLEQAEIVAALTAGAVAVVSDAPA
jgi:hypothetical protein